MAGNGSGPLQTLADDLNTDKERVIVNVRKQTRKVTDDLEAGTSALEEAMRNYYGVVTAQEQLLLSDESLGTFGRRKWRRKQRKARATSQKLFMLRTEERGKCKEEEFMKKLQQMLEEEEKLRVPIAQGLPWTTDEPECLVKPPVKEKTRPVDPVLHTDVRAMERAEFDQQVAEKMSLIEQYRMEREMRQKLEEEEEITRLRKVLVPRAQPMPYFDRPFIPRRSSKHPTIPKEAKLHVPQHKKIRCNMSFDGLSMHSGSDWQRMD